MRRQQYDDTMRFWLTKDMKIDLWDEAAQKDMSASDLVRRIVEQWLKGDRKLVLGGKTRAMS